MTVRVLIVDDLAASRETLRRALAFDETIAVVGEAGSGTEAVAKTDELRPDLVLMDVRMPDGDGVEATRHITKRFPRTRVVALTAYDDKDTVREMLMAGAAGYFLKGAPVDDLLSAVQKAHLGEEQIDRRVLPNALADLRRLLREERSQRAEAERLASLRQELLQILSHELRTPLTIMAGALRFVQRRGLTPDESALVESALSRAGELERLVEGLELLGEPPCEPGTTANPARAVREAYQRLRDRPDMAELVDEDWPAIRPRHLSRIATELLSNALRHGRRPVTVRTYRTGGEAVLEVADAGDFILNPELFDAFAQADMSSTREKGGLGLGLFLAQRLCEADEGQLSLRRENGRTIAEARYEIAGAGPDED